MIYKTSNNKKIECILKQGQMPLFFTSEGKAAFSYNKQVKEALLQYDIYYCFKNK